MKARRLNIGSRLRTCALPVRDSRRWCHVPVDDASILRGCLHRSDAWGVQARRRCLCEQPPRVLSAWFVLLSLHLRTAHTGGETAAHRHRVNGHRTHSRKTKASGHGGDGIAGAVLGLSTPQAGRMTCWAMHRPTRQPMAAAPRLRGWRCSASLFRNKTKGNDDENHRTADVKAAQMRH